MPCCSGSRFKLLHLMMALVLFCGMLYTVRNWGLLKASSTAIAAQLTSECDTTLAREARAREENQPTLPPADVRLVRIYFKVTSKSEFD